MTQDGFGLSFVPVKINGHRGRFLVDSGASHTVLDFHFARKSLESMTASDLRLAWLGARNAQTKEGIVNEIRIGDFRQDGPFRAHVLNLDAINNAPSRKRTLRMDGILGADFFSSHGAIIDYRANALRFGPSDGDWTDM